MTKLIYKIDQAVEEMSLLKHPFYRMWSNGELNLNHLQGYSLEYFQLVKVVPEMVNNIRLNLEESKSRNLIEASQNEETSHIELWVKFANSIDVKREQLLNHEFGGRTRQAINSLLELTKNSLHEGVCAMYAYELELPKISRSKIDGLNKYYNISSAESINYFETHQEADIRHAEIWRDMIENIPTEKHSDCFAAAVKSLQSQNLLLDSVYEKYVSPYN